MSTERFGFASFLALVVVVAGCAASSSDRPGGTGDAGATGAAGTGSSAGSAGTGGGAGTGAATGAAGTNGAAGTTGAAGTGAAGTMGAAGSGSAGTTGAAGTGVPGCQVQLYRVLPPVLGAAGPGAEVPLGSVAGLESGTTLRLKARAEGFSGQAEYAWTVEIEGAAAGARAVELLPLDDTAQVIDVSLSRPGIYNISAAVKSVAQCRAAFQHQSVREPSSAAFVFRVTPPPGSRLPTRELSVLSADAASGPRVLDLGPGGTNQLLSISPIDGSSRPLPSFVKLSSPSFGFEMSGYTGSGPLLAALDAALTYELLIVPESDLAPVLLRGDGKPAFFDTRMVITPGITVHGDTRDFRGRAVEGTRILLRADTGRPSTIGVSNATGDFLLQTREGPHSITVVPPEGSGLPEARVPLSAGFVLATGTFEIDLAVKWSSSNQAAPLDVVVRDQGAVVEGARVRADLWSELPSVAQVSVKVGGVVGAMDVAFTAKGAARADGVTDAKGEAHLGPLPVAKYRVTVAPPEGGAAAITSTDVDLNGGPSVPLALGARVKVTGTLLPAADAVGVRVTALDTGVLAPTAPATAIADANGRYELVLSPGRTYELIAEPPGGKRWQRVALARAAMASSGATWSHSLPGALSWSGSVTGAGRAVAGAVVQVFCVAPPASCVDSTIPLAEGVSRADGTIALTLPAFAN
jgi:hypothetical protein